MFGTPTLAQVPAGGTRTARYAVFLARLPAGTHSIKDVVIRSHSLDLISASGRLATSLPAHAIGEHLA
jgi:hypothetical protein